MHFTLRHSFFTCQPVPIRSDAGYACHLPKAKKHFYILPSARISSYHRIAIIPSYRYSIIYHPIQGYRKPKHTTSKSHRISQTTQQGNTKTRTRKTHFFPVFVRPHPQKIEAGQQNTYACQHHAQLNLVTARRKIGETHTPAIIVVINPAPQPY